MRRSKAIQLRALSKLRRHALAEGQLVGAGQRGESNRRILLDRTVDGVERRFHATKGWRTRRVAA